MKSFIVVVVLSAIAVAVQCGLTKVEQEAAFRAIAASCKEESGATDADIEVMLKHEPSGSMEAKCMGACVVKKLNVMDDNGKFVKETAMKFAELHTQGDAGKMKTAEEIIDACKDIDVSDNHCEASEQYGHCMKEEAKKRGIDTSDF